VWKSRTFLIEEKIKNAPVNFVALRGEKRGESERKRILFQIWTELRE
jgi:hypothetical protein